MSDRSQKNIEEVKVGDKVIGYDGKKMTAETVLQLDSPIRDHLYILRFIDGSTLSLTREHPLYTKEGWKAVDPQSTIQEMPGFKVGRLMIGDTVFNDKGEYVEIVSMEYKPGRVQTYNLKEVSKNNNFFADSYLAHNKKNTIYEGPVAAGAPAGSHGAVTTVGNANAGTEYNEAGGKYVTCDGDCGGRVKSGGGDDAGGGGGTTVTTTATTTTTEVTTTTQTTTPGGENYCKALTVSNTLLDTGGTLTLSATANTKDIAKFSYKLFNLDNLDAQQKPKPIWFTANVPYELIDPYTITTDNDVLPIPFEILNKNDLNWTNYMPKPKRVRVEVYFTDTAAKVSKQDDKCTVNFNVNTIDPTPTPNPACVCATGDTCATACFFDKYPTGVVYNSPIKCSLGSNIFSSVPTTTNKTQWCRNYLRTKGDANGDGKVNILDYFYYVAAIFGAKLPPSVNIDLNGDGFISSIDRAILIKTLKP